MRYILQQFRVRRNETPFSSSPTAFNFRLCSTTFSTSNVYLYLGKLRLRSSGAVTRMPQTVEEAKKLNSTRIHENIRIQRMYIYFYFYATKMDKM